MLPSHQFATTLLNLIDDACRFLGLSRSAALEETIYVVSIFAIAILIGWGLRWLILAGLRRWVRLRDAEWGHLLLQANTLGSCCKMIPPLVVLACLPLAFDTASFLHALIMRGVSVWFFITLGIGLSSIFKFVWINYDSRANQRHLPLKGIYEVAVGITWIVLGIICICVIIDKSPGIILGGLGAFAAALMLIFKDSILGFVAGIQMSNNDMLHVGDWITVPGTPADGVVTDVTISVVKVLNFDNTLIMLPPYTLVSQSFQNWRSMGESGIRRISRSILIDSDTIKTDSADPSTTNLTRYRAWCLNYLNNHPRLNHTTGGNALTMVRLMPMEAAGVPMQLYCFTNTTVWPDYEAIQSEIMEHVIAAAPQFSLRVYNYPASISSAGGN